MNNNELKRNFRQAARIFLLSTVIAFAVALLAYAVVILFSEPEPVNETISGTTNGALAKVEMGARYVGLTASIFLFNSIAALTGSAGAALVVFIHRMLLSDLALRQKHDTYTAVSRKIEEIGQFLFRGIEWVFPAAFAGFPEEPESQRDSVWNYYGYDRRHYRIFASALPWAPPFLVCAANGAILGLLLAFVVANGADGGMELYGTGGLITGALAGLVYFAAFIVPHGIIEIPALLLAAALGYGFAVRHSALVQRELLFAGDSAGDLDMDIRKSGECAFAWLKSPGFRKWMLVCICMLFVAACVETLITPGLAGWVIGGWAYS